MRFSTTFFYVAILTLVGFSAASCAYIIPDNPNAPRNNTVLGERRKPELNTMVGPQSAVARPTAPGEQQIAAANIAPEPMVNLPSDRHVPVENMEFQVAANDRYPSLNSVPPRPQMTGPDSAQERLSATRATLEQDRANAMANKAALDKDAAEEPSMLSDLPKTDGVVPPGDPVRVAPVANPVPATGPASVVVPAPREIRSQPPVAPSSSIAPIAPVALAPVAKPVTVTASPAVSLPPPAVAPAPIVSASAEPVSPAPITVRQAYVPPEAASRPNVKPGDFDPLAVADNAPIATQSSKANRSMNPSYASNRYIAPSRYAERRY